MFENTNNNNNKLDFSLLDIKKLFDEQTELFNQKFEGIDRKFEGIDRKFEGIYKQFEIIDRRFDEIDRQLKEQKELINNNAGAIAEIGKMMEKLQEDGLARNITFRRLDHRDEIFAEKLNLDLRKIDAEI